MIKKLVTGPGLLIGIPTLGRPVPLAWAFALKSMNPPINFNCSFSTIYNKPVAEARNMIAQQAVEQDFKYLFFVGDDVVCPPHTLRQLIFRMEHDPKLGVVGGVYFSKTEPPAPLVFRENGGGSYWDWKVGEYFECAGLGMDATLIRVEMLKELAKPWFKTVDVDDFLAGKNYAEQWTEDLYFLKQVYEESTYDIYCDAGIICEHHDIYSNKVFTLPPNSLPTRRLTVDKQLKAIDIGCGMVDRQEQFKDYTLVRVDIRDECNPEYRCDVRSLPFDNNEFDLVFSSHVLEHFPRAECSTVLKEWIRVLKQGGKLILCLPNIKWAAERLMNGVADGDVMNVLYGAQSYATDFHYNGLTPEILTAMLGDEFTEPKFTHQGYNMILEAEKK